MNYTTNDTKEFVSKIVANAMYQAFCKLKPLAFEEEPKKWTMKNTSQLRQLSSMASSIGYHYKHGFVENKFYELSSVCTLKRKEKCIFSPNTYFVNPITGDFRSSAKNTREWGSAKGEKLKCICKKGDDGSFSYVQIKKFHLIFSAICPNIYIDTIDHIDGNHCNNSIFNLDNVTISMNTKRMHKSEKGNQRSIKSGNTLSRAIWMLDDDKNKVQKFKSTVAVGEYIRSKQLSYSKYVSSGIVKAIKKGQKRYGYYWCYDCINPTREATVAKHPLIIKYYEQLSKRRKEQISKKLSGNIHGHRTPKAVTNYGEIKTMNNIWTTGNLCNRRSTASKYVGLRAVHVWVMLYFHDNDDDIDKYLQGELEILHKDGDKNDESKYHYYTHEDSDDNKPYTNALFTLRFGTRQDNAQDLSAKIKRLKKSLAFNLTNLLDIC